MNTKFIQLLALFMLLATGMKAQTGVSEVNPSVSDNNNVIYMTIPTKLKIKDKIYIRNKSPYYILQIVVAVPNGKGELEPLGSATYIAPNETWELASFRNNSLKYLRGKNIAVKTKGVKVYMGEQNGTKVWTPYGSVSVRHKELDPNIINNIKPEDITYSFDVKLFEANHDLYLDIYNSGENGKDVMDF